VARRRAADPLAGIALALEGCRLDPGTAVVVAVSGGADSVFLLRALHRLAGPRRLELTVAHLDHGWRGAAGAADAAWVAALAGTLGLPFRGGRVDAAAEARRRRRSPEDAARRLRYAFLRDVCRAVGAPAVATGHTADDQVETVLLALLRGSGPAGLAGMAAAGPLPAPGSAGLRLVRPLLGLERAALRPALEALGQPWREDATNLDPALPRNRLRLEVAPLLAALAPGYRRAVARAARLSGEAAAYLGEMGARAGNDLFRPEGAALVAERRALLALHPALRAAVLRWAVARCAEAGAATGVAPDRPAVPEAAHLDGALATLARGRGGATAWLTPGLRLRLERGRARIEPAGAGGDNGEPRGGQRHRRMGSDGERAEGEAPGGGGSRGRILEIEPAAQPSHPSRGPEEPCR
jgi:tRNA(Ile)-lysidine synthetase-like protein